MVDWSRVGLNMGDMAVLVALGVVTDDEAVEISNLSRVVSRRFPKAAINLVATSSLSAGEPPRELAAATNDEILGRIEDTMAQLNATMERLAVSSENGEAVTKLNTLLQFLAVLLAVVAMMQNKQAAPSSDEPPGPAPTTVTKVVEPPTPGPLPSSRPKGHG